MRWWSPGAERNAPRSVWTAQFYRTTLSILINPDDHLSNQVSWRTLTINSLHRVPTLSNIWWHIKVLVSVYAWIAINDIKDQVHWAGTTVHLNRKSEISVKLICSLCSTAFMWEFVFKFKFKFFMSNQKV